MGLDQGMVDSVGGLHGKYSQHNIEKDNPTVGELENNHWNQQSGDDNIDVNGKLKQDPMGQAESFSILGAIKNVLARLGTKLGYIKKSPNSESVVDATTAEEYYEFQCMTVDDQPILVSGQPVMVRDPHSCQQYYTEGQGAGYASVTEPPAVFMELARGTFKSDDQDLDDRVIRQLWDENQELRDQVNQMRTNVGDQGDEAMAAILRDRINKLLTANADLEREVARLRYTDAESVETFDKLWKTRDALNGIDKFKIEDDLNIDKDHDDDDDDDDDNDDEDDDEIKNKSMYNFSKYLSGLVKVGNKILTKQKTIDWVQAKRFVGGLKEVISAKFGEAGVLAKDNIAMFVNKFDELNTFVNTEKMKENRKATEKAAEKLVEGLVEAVKDMKDASEDAAEKSDSIKKFKSETHKVKSELEKEWSKIMKKWQHAISKDSDEDDDDDDDEDDDDDDDE